MIPMDTNKNNNNSSKEAKAYLPPAEDVILKFMNKRAYKGTFIDFGCNDGYFTFTSEKFFTNVIGVDLSIDTINELLRTRPESSDAKFIRSHNYTTALPDGSADVIFMFHILKKIPNVKQFVKEIKRLLNFLLAFHTSLRNSKKNKKNEKIQLMTNIITVTAQIGKHIYQVEMERKETFAEMISEVAVVLEVSEKSIKILNY